MLFYYINRLKELGPSGLKRTISSRYAKHSYGKKNRHKALKHSAHHTWEQLCANYNLPNDFGHFFKDKLSTNFLHVIYHDQLFQQHLPTYLTSQESTLQEADKLSSNNFSILGARKSWQQPQDINWHEDLKLTQTDALGFASHQKANSTNRSTFYQDIKIQQHQGQDLSCYCFDVKVPWELSRMQQTFPLGKAYLLTKKHVYAKSWYKQVESWLDSNPYLLGVNWVCPMDIAIRATNLIWGIYFFRDDEKVPLRFWQKLICSLYDHATYLESNWETSDKPNNHYLADLVGHLYLCSLFRFIPQFETKQKKTFYRLQQQFNKQIQADGSSYEGSTHYHKLVTEMYLHTMLVSNIAQLGEKQLLAKKFKAMLQFLQSCSVNKHYLLQIGDNDSGKFVAGFAIPAAKPAHNIATYKNFGISVLTHKKWHITLRHATYSPHQPSGHFHEDQLSITASLNKQPLIIDPGSYLYTANGSWRNVFRSIENHNTFSLPTLHTQQNSTSDLFQLTRNKHLFSNSFQENDMSIWGDDFHDLYQEKKIRAHRRITLDKTRNQFVIEDWFEGRSRRNKTLPRTRQKALGIEGEQGHWSLIFHPDVSLHMNEENKWLLTVHKKVVATLESTLPFVLDNAFYSPAYGKRKPCKKLIALKSIMRAPGSTHCSRREVITLTAV